MSTTPPPMPGAPPIPPAETKKPWYKRKLVILGIIALVIIIAAVAGSGGKDEEGATDGGQARRPTAKTAGLNQAARDGKFEFTVTKIECGKTQVGSADFNKKAQGQFCFVSVTVKNIGDEPQSLFGDNQYLYDSRNRKFSADSEAAIYLEDSKTLYEEINPGNTLNGIIIYDVPKDASPAKIELHDSAFSGGVTVTLA